MRTGNCWDISPGWAPCGAAPLRPAEGNALLDYGKWPPAGLRREGTDGRLVTVVNTDRAEQRLSLPWSGDTATDLLTGQEFFPEEGTLTLCIPPRGGFLLG